MMTLAVLGALAFGLLIGAAVGARHGTALRQRTLVRYIRRRAVSAGESPTLGELASDIEAQWPDGATR